MFEFFQFAREWMSDKRLPMATMNSIELKTEAKAIVRQLLDSRDKIELEGLCAHCGRVNSLDKQVVLTCTGFCDPVRSIHGACSTVSERARNPYKCHDCSYGVTPADLNIPEPVHESLLPRLLHVANGVDGRKVHPVSEPSEPSFDEVIIVEDSTGDIMSSQDPVSVNPGPSTSGLQLAVNDSIPKEGDNSIPNLLSGGFAVPEVPVEHPKPKRKRQKFDLCLKRRREHKD